MGSSGRAKNIQKKKVTASQPINVENEDRKEKNNMKSYSRPDNVVQDKNDSVTEALQMNEKSVSTVESKKLVQNNPKADKSARKKSCSKSTTTVSSDSDGDEQFVPAKGAEKSTHAKGSAKKQKKSKNRKKKGQKKKVASKKSPQKMLENDEDIDKILEEFREMEVAPREPPKLNLLKLLTVQYRNLQPENEYDRKRGIVRKDRMPRAAGRMVIAKPTWPALKSAGIRMQRYNCALDPELLYFTFEYDDQYRIFEHNLELVSVPSPAWIFRMLARAPYHVPTLIHGCECVAAAGQYERAQELIGTVMLIVNLILSDLERAIYAYESAQHCMFNVISGKCRLLYSIPNNRRALVFLFENLHFLIAVFYRGFFVVLMKQLFFCMRQEFFRTALEYAKVIYNLNPEEDPMAAVLVLDYLLLVNREYETFVKFYTAKEKAVSLPALPNMSYSIALARFFIAKKSGLQEDYDAADKALLEAMVRFPTLLPALFSTLNLDYEPADYFNSWCYNKFFREDKSSLTLLYNLYMSRMAFVWKERGVAVWVERICRQFGQYMTEADSDFSKQMAEYTIIRNRCYYGVPSNVLRHLYLMDCRHFLSGTEEMKKFGIVNPCDPFPPPKKVINMFNRGAAPAVQILAPTTSFAMDMLGNVVFRPYEALRALISRLIGENRNKSNSFHKETATPCGTLCQADALVYHYFGKYIPTKIEVLIFNLLGVVESENTMLPSFFDSIQYTCRYCPTRCGDLITFMNHMSVHQGMRPFVCNHCGNSYADAGEKEEHVKTHHGAEVLKSSSLLESSDVKRLVEEPPEQEDKEDSDSEQPESVAYKIFLKNVMLKRMMNLTLSGPTMQMPLKQPTSTSNEPLLKLGAKGDGNSKTQLNDVVGKSETQLIQGNGLGATEKTYKRDHPIANKRQVEQFPVIPIRRIDGTNIYSSIAVDKTVIRNRWKKPANGKAKDPNPLPAIRLAVRKHKAKKELDYESLTMELRFRKAQFSMKNRFKREKKDQDQQ
ncbi:Transcription factor 25 [Trichinella pseudospiralis]|uniref:Transcription factor 25 n=1 Tax=Trichinella pseudospiralis TaxID=6337 RepID=A0A0V1FTI5_TRIPS|nr:Transcription factor 25 [Trichinella pseudospiralis]